MRRRLLALLALAAATVAVGQRAARPYFSNDRPIQVPQPDRQSYVVIDDAVWQHARADLGDLRIYDAAGQEVPYAITFQGEHTNTRNVDARVFNLAKGARGTEFLLEIYPDAGSVRQYDRVNLKIDAKDFVGKADVEASDDASAAKWAEVGSYSIFDFTKEKLGCNFELRLPTLRYRFLRVVLHAPVAPEQVKGSSVADFQRTAASWVATGTAPKIHLSGARNAYDEGTIPRLQKVDDPRSSTIIWTQPEHAPLERIVFDVGGTNNFRRGFELFDGKGHVIGSGEISRIHMQREGQVIDSQRLEPDLPGLHSDAYALLIYNGDDPPLDIKAVHPQAIERRVYFDPAGHDGLKLYYGDEKASAPVYDYAKLFQLQPTVARANLGADEHNAAYTGRPDERPWTDRHPWVMWAALIVVIVVLGGIALRGMKA